MMANNSTNRKKRTITSHHESLNITNTMTCDIRTPCPCLKQYHDMWYWNSMPLFETIPWHVILENSMPLFETGTTYVAGLAPERKILISFLLLKFCNLFLLLVDPYQYNVHLPYFPLFFYLKDLLFINLLSS